MIKRTLLSLAIAAAVTGCNTDDSDDNTSATSTPTATPTVANAYLRVWHASPDAPSVNVYVNDALTLESVDYRGVSPWLAVPAGTHDIEVRAITPGGEVSVIDTQATVLADYTYEIAAVGDTANIAPAVIGKMMDSPASGSVDVQVAHLAPDAPQVDVYVTAPNADLSSAMPTATLAFGENTDELTVPAGDYHIRITAAGDATALVFDSGTVALAADTELFISALENTDANSDVPVTLTVSDGTDSFNIYDADQGADVIIVHNSADTDPVDITADGFNTLLVDSLAFEANTGVVNLAAATYNLDVGVEDTNATAIDINDLALANAMEYSVIAVGNVGGAPEALEVMLLDDSDNRSEATHAKVRIVHGSTAAGPVDIYVTEQGDTDLSDNTPAFENVPYKANTGYVDLAAGDVTVHVAVAGTTTVAIQADLTLTAGQVSTAIARDARQGETDLGLILY